MYVCTSTSLSAVSGWRICHRRNVCRRKCRTEGSQCLACTLDMVRACDMKCAAGATLLYNTDEMKCCYDYTDVVDLIWLYCCVRHGTCNATQRALNVMSVWSVAVLPQPHFDYGSPDEERRRPAGGGAEETTCSGRCIHQQQRRERNLLVGTVPYCTSVGFRH